MADRLRCLVGLHVSNTPLASASRRSPAGRTRADRPFAPRSIVGLQALDRFADRRSTVRRQPDPCPPGKGRCDFHMREYERVRSTDRRRRIRAIRARLKSPVAELKASRQLLLTVLRVSRFDRGVLRYSRQAGRSAGERGPRPSDARPHERVEQRHPAPPEPPADFLPQLGGQRSRARSGRRPTGGQALRRGVEPPVVHRGKVAVALLNFRQSRPRLDFPAETFHRLCIEDCLSEQWTSFVACPGLSQRDCDSARDSYLFAGATVRCQYRRAVS
jgi:hypothetical protein